MDSDRRSDNSIGARMRQGVQGGWAGWSGASGARKPAPEATQGAPSSSADLANPAATHALTHDLATGLPNTALFHDRLECALRRADRGKSWVAVACVRAENYAALALDDTKSAEALVLVISQRLALLVRTTDTVARVAPGEFALILEGLHSGSSVDLLGDKILKACTAPCTLLLGDEGKALDIAPRVSVGLALWPIHGPGQRELVNGALAALQHANGGVHVHRATDDAQGKLAY